MFLICGKISSKKDTVLYLIDKIIFLQKETKKDPDTGKRVTKETLIFPRYHQFNAVRKLVADVVEHHSEKNYLIEHSAAAAKPIPLHGWHTALPLYTTGKTKSFLIRSALSLTVSW